MIKHGLDRNHPKNKGKGKYALVKLREIKGNPLTNEELMLGIVKNPNALDFGMMHSDGEFFVLRLKDKYAAAALEAYAKAVFDDGDKNLKNYASQIVMMAERARRHPARKKPD